MSSRQGNETQREGARRTFTQTTPRGELRQDDIVAMESFRQHRLPNKTGESDTSPRAQSGFSVAAVVQSTVSPLSRDTRASPQAKCMSDNSNATGSETTVLAAPNSPSNNPTLSSTSAGHISSQKPCPQAVLVQIPREALSALKETLGDTRFLKEFDVDSEQLLVGYADNEDAWNSISKLCSIDLLPRKRVINLSLSIGGAAGAWVSLNIHIKGVLAIATLLVGLPTGLALGWGATFSHSTYYHICETAAVVACTRSYLEGSKQYLFSIGSLPWLVKEFFRTIPVRAHRALNRLLQEVLLWALQSLGDLQDGSIAHA